MKLTRFIDELRRRRVVRAAVAYAAALFLVLQVADIVVPALRLPESVLTGIVLVGALGFPLAMVLAWATSWSDGTLVRETAPNPAASATTGGRRRGQTTLLLVGALGVVGGSIWWALRGGDAAGSRAAVDPTSIRSLAVLPLANLTGAEDQLHFVDGMHDLLISELSRIEGLSVISQRSVLRFRDSDLPISAIAETLSVQALIEGSVFRQGDSVRVTARLVQPNPESDLWRAEYRGRLSEAMAVQSRVARAVADEIEITLSARTQAYLARDVPVVTPEAMDAYLLGRDIWKARDPARMPLAIGYFERAVEIDPDFALGWAGVADGYTVAAGYQALPVSREEAVRRAEAAIDSALILEPGLLDAIAARGGMRLYLKQDFRGAERDLAYVVELAPSHAQAHDWLGDALAADGRVDEAVRHYERAVELDPLSALMHRDYARGLFQVDDCDAALEQAGRSLELDPDHLPAAALIFNCRLHMGQPEEGIEDYLQFLEESDWGVAQDVETIRAAVGSLRRAWENGGLRAFLLADALQMESVMHILSAMRYAEADAADEAFEQIFASIEARESLVIMLRAAPSFTILRDDPRWDEALRRLDALGEGPAD